jgi:hypothetical protein
LLLGHGGSGGISADYAPGGRGGNGGLFFGVGGDGGFGGTGLTSCDTTTNKCSVTTLGGAGGRGGTGGLFGRNGGDGGGQLALNAPQFSGYTPVYVAGEVDAATGKASTYPNPYYVDGTQKTVQLKAGKVLQRFGAPFGGFLTDEGTPFDQLALPPLSQTAPFAKYVVKDPAALPPGYRIEQSEVAPYFGQPGRGTQYRVIFTTAEGKDVDGSILALLNSGYLVLK